MAQLNEKALGTQPTQNYTGVPDSPTNDDHSSDKGYTLDQKTEGGSQHLLADSPPTLSEEQIKALYRKIDWRCVFDFVLVVRG